MIQNTNENNGCFFCVVPASKSMALCRHQIDNPMYWMLTLLENAIQLAASNQAAYLLTPSCELPGPLSATNNWPSGATQHAVDGLMGTIFHVSGRCRGLLLCNVDGSKLELSTQVL